MELQQNTMPSELQIKIIMEMGCRPEFVQWFCQSLILIMCIDLF